MSAALAALVAAFAGALLGGVVASLIYQRRSSPQPSAPAGYDESALRPVLARVNATKEAVERVQGDLNDLSREVRKLAAVGQTGGSSGGQQAGPQRTAPSSDDRRGRIEPGGSMRPGDDPGLRGAPFRPGIEHGGSQLPDVYGRQTSPAAGDFGGTFDRQPGVGGDLVLEEDPYAGTWDAGGASSGPPANAVNVEARDDRIVASSSYPPEAWLEIGPGPAEGRVTLNPAVALNEYALRRLSTFFEWQGARAGSSYDTVRPATVRWDDGQRVGTLLQRGTARPR